MYTKTNSVCTRCGDGKLLDGKNHFISRFYVRICIDTLKSLICIVFQCYNDKVHMGGCYGEK